MKDLIILGNGMAGMTAALYAKRANLDFKIVGKDEFDFGQIGNAILVENYPCAAAQTGFDLAMKLHDQLEENGVQIEEGEVMMVSDASTAEGEKCFLITYTDFTCENAKTIIYALGATPRQLNCEIEEGIPIHYCALCDGPLYKDKTVAIIGGGDVAFTQAEYLSKICKEVMIVMCDDNITAAPQTYDRVKKIKNIDIIMNYPVDEVINNQYWTKQLSIGSDNKWIHADGIFVAIGMKPNTKPLKNLIPLHDGGYINCWEDSLQSMHMPRLYAAGDVRVKKVRQSITAAADGAIAVQSVIDYLKKRE